MHIVLTNDDGIFAPGLAALYAQLKSIAQVTVIAPDRERSATSHAITMHKPLRLEEVKLNEHGDIGWAVSGTPSDCIKLGLKVIVKETPDLIISGINDGPNLGTDVLYSGTVSAAIEGILHNIPSIAVSLASFEKCSFAYAARITEHIVQQVMAKELFGHTLLNINIPSVPAEQLRGIKVTKLGIREYENIIEMRRDPRGRTYYWLGGDIVDRNLEQTDIDISAVKNGYVSITPLHFDLTNHALLGKLETWQLTL
jgi:5'-nucleotidase